MNREKILSLVNQIYFGPQENKLITPIRAKLRALLPDSGISDLIFHDERDLTPEQVVDEAIRRQIDSDNKNPPR